MCLILVNCDSLYVKNAFTELLHKPNSTGKGLGTAMVAAGAQEQAPCWKSLLHKPSKVCNNLWKSVLKSLLQLGFHLKSSLCYHFLDETS